MNFRVNKISKKKYSKKEKVEPPKVDSPPQETSKAPEPSTTEEKIVIPKKFKTPSKRTYTLGLPIVISLAIIILLTAGIVKAVSSLDFAVFMEIAGDELQKDAYGHTNFLVLGSGGENHEGGDLTDTILVVSLDNENNLVTLVSIPRDLYIQDTEIGNSRINEVFYYATNYYGSSAEGLEHIKEKVEETMGIPIHYWLHIDFTGFKELVDALGGIDIYVEEAIYDPYYPKDGTYLYETFSISEGQHHLDGETALKYARSRKTTSDFDRARRQQQIIFAIKEKAIKTAIAIDQQKITELLNTLRSNIQTNIRVKEILSLGAMAQDFSEDQISHRLIHDDPNQCGGFLYTPDREYYNGMFVLIPAGGYDYIHKYADLNFSFPKIAHEDSKIHILNGTSIGGVAGETKQVLQRYCFDVIRFGNSATQNVETTTYYYKKTYDEDGNEINSRPAALDFLQKMIPGIESTDISDEHQQYLLEADILIEIGSDYATSSDYVIDPFYYLPPPKSYTTEEDTTEEDTSSTETSQ